MTHWIIKCAIGLESFCVVRTNYLYLLNLITLKRGFPVLKSKVLYCKSRFHEFVSWVVCIRGATGVERRFHGNKRVKLDTSHLFKTRLMSSDSTQHNSVKHWNSDRHEGHLEVFRLTHQYYQLVREFCHLWSSLHSKYRMWYGIARHDFWRKWLVSKNHLDTIMILSWHDTAL